jgi:hypothetical protein
MGFSVLRSVLVMKTEAAIKHAGSATELAQLLKVTVGAISQWGDYPPPARQLQLQKITRGKLKAEPDCMDRLLGVKQAARA